VCCDDIAVVLQIALQRGTMSVLSRAPGLQGGFDAFRVLDKGDLVAIDKDIICAVPIS
jgi:hypothetical protein